MAEADGDEAEPEVQCALVEYVLGNVQTRKWTLVLGQTYSVGKKGSGSDIEIDHDSISRRHCSLALTAVDEDLVLVMMDRGSTNGTFVDKVRLEKGVGLTKKLAELRFIVFGLCENGYRVIARGQETNDKGAAASAPKVPKIANKRGGPLDADQKAQIERLKRLGGGGGDDAPPARRRSRSREAKKPRDAQDEWKEKAEKAKAMSARAKRREKEREERMSTGQSAPRPSSRDEPGSKDKSKTAWRSDPEAYAAKKASSRPAPESGGDTADIEWPEDWK